MFTRSRLAIYKLLVYNKYSNHQQVHGRTWCTWALEDDLLSGDNGEPRAGVVAAGGVAELGPVAALDGRLGEARAGELADAGGGGDLHLVAVVVEAVLDRLLEPVLVGPDDDAGREEEVEVAPVVLLELAPSDLRRRHGCRWALGFGVRRCGRRRTLWFGCDLGMCGPD